MGGEFFDWSLLGTYAAAPVLVTLLTQVAKQFLAKVDPKWIALLWSLVLLIGYRYVTGDIAVGSIIAAVINALIVTGESIGAYEGVIKAIAKR